MRLLRRLLLCFDQVVYFRASAAAPDDSLGETAEAIGSYPDQETIRESLPTVVMLQDTVAAGPGFLDRLNAAQLILSASADVTLGVQGGGAVLTSLTADPLYLICRSGMECRMPNGDVGFWSVYNNATVVTSSSEEALSILATQQCSLAGGGAVRLDAAYEQPPSQPDRSQGRNVQRPRPRPASPQNRSKGGLVQQLRALPGRAVGPLDPGVTARRRALRQVGGWPAAAAQSSSNVNAAAAGGLSVCIRNHTSVATQGPAFWHFFQGVLIDTLLLLEEHNWLANPGLRLHFEERMYTEKAEAFFPLWLPSRSVPDYRACDPLVDHVVSHDQHRFTRSQAALWYRRCRHVPSVVEHMHTLVHGGAYARRSRAHLRLILLQRSGPRGIRNFEAFKAQLRVACDRHSVELVVARPEKMTAEAQSKLVLGTDVLVGFHGSGTGSLNYYLGNDTLMVEVMPARTWHCTANRCAAVPQRSLTWLQLYSDRGPGSTTGNASTHALASDEQTSHRYADEYFAQNWRKERDRGREVQGAHLQMLLEHCFRAWRSGGNAANVITIAAEQNGWKRHCDSTCIRVPS